MKFFLTLFLALPLQAAGSNARGQKASLAGSPPTSTHPAASLQVPAQDFSLPLPPDMRMPPADWHGQPLLERGDAVALTIEGDAADRRIVGYYRTLDEAKAVLGKRAARSRAVTLVEKEVIRANPFLEIDFDGIQRRLPLVEGAYKIDFLAEPTNNISLITQQLNRVTDIPSFTALPPKIYRADLTQLMPARAALLAGRHGTGAANCINAANCVMGFHDRLEYEDVEKFEWRLKVSGFQRVATPRSGDIGGLFEMGIFLSHAFVVLMRGTNEGSQWNFTKNGLNNQNAYRFQRHLEMIREYGIAAVRYYRSPDSPFPLDESPDR